MSSRLNTRQALQGRTVQFKETARRPVPVLLPSAYSHETGGPMVPVCLGSSESKIHITYCTSPQDGEVDSTDVEETKGMHLSYLPHDGEASSTRGVHLHVTVEKTVERYGVSRVSPEDLPPLESKYEEV